jgi:hypothetical protein
MPIVVLIVISDYCFKVLNLLLMTQQYVMAHVFQHTLQHIPLIAMA